MGYLKSLEIENFKSYRGKHFIGPFKRFMSIIGPNGSGKTDLMDAICFVLGETAQDVGVRRLGDLIHGASIGKPIGTRCYVKMTFVNVDETEITLKRTVTSAGSEFRVDGNIVTKKEYCEYAGNICIKSHASGNGSRPKPVQVDDGKVEELLQDYDPNAIPIQNDHRGEFNRNASGVSGGSNNGDKDINNNI